MSHRADLLRLDRELQELASDLICKRTHDPFAPIDQEVQLKSALYDRWDYQVQRAADAMRKAAPFFTIPSVADVPKFMAVLEQHLSGPAITNAVLPVAMSTIGQAFDLGKQHIDHTFKKQTGKDPVKKDDLLFGALFGLTEDHALEALTQQVQIAAGGMWDDQLSDSIRTEMESWFEGSISREELTDKLMSLVNERLATEGRSLARSYFDNLSTHIINRSRNIGGYYRANSLGAKHYLLRNPNDDRTSEICSEITQGQLYTMAGAGTTISALLGARSTSELKQAAPFLTPETAATAQNPWPPCHWGGCRTWAEFVFEGL